MRRSYSVNTCSSTTFISRRRRVGALAAELGFDLEAADRGVKGVVEAAHVRDLAHLDDLEAVVVGVVAQDVANGIFGEVAYRLDVAEALEVLVLGRDRRRAARRWGRHRGG